MRWWCTVLAWFVGDLIALVACWPDWSILVHRLPAVDDWVRTVGVDVVAGRLGLLAIWLVAAWTAAALGLAVAMRAPGPLGHGAAVLGRRIMPRAMRSILGGAAGLVLVGGPALSCAAGAQATPVRAPAVLTAPSVAADSAAAGSGPSTDTGRLPAPAWPTDADRNNPPPAEPPPKTVRVHPDDSLWLIAAHRLGPKATPAQIAALWPRWYQANSSVIGPDPDLLHPGQQLRDPASTAGEPR
jgi:hypothetical protein